jgi:hypothetical protein
MPSLLVDAAVPAPVSRAAGRRALSGGDVGIPALPHDHSHGNEEEGGEDLEGEGRVEPTDGQVEVLGRRVVVLVRPGLAAAEGEGRGERGSIVSVGLRDKGMK